MATELDVNNNGAIDISRGGTDGTTALAARANLLVTKEVEFYGDLNRAVTALAGGSPVTLTFSTNQTLTGNLFIPSHIQLVPLNGATITTTGYTLTGLKEVRPEWFGINTSPGTTDMGVAIQAAINAAPKIIFDRTTYAKSTVITVPANRELIGYGATITTTADNTNGFTVTGSNVTFRGLTINGPQYATLSTSRGISAVGASSAAYLENLKVIDCNISSWGIYGVYMQFVDGFDRRCAPKDRCVVRENDAASCQRVAVSCGVGKAVGSIERPIGDHAICQRLLCAEGRIQEFVRRQRGGCDSDVVHIADEVQIA